MSRREQALSVLHRLRALQQSQQALAHRCAQQEEHARHHAAQHARSDLAVALNEAGQAVPGGMLSLERDRMVAQLLGVRRSHVLALESEHRQATERRDAAAQAHLSAQQQCDHVAERLADERAQLQHQREMSAYDQSSDLRLARHLSGDGA
mgnify:CR=1 FL=1